jgi:hypothetical protein
MGAEEHMFLDHVAPRNICELTFLGRNRATYPILRSSVETDEHIRPYVLWSKTKEHIRTYVPRPTEEYIRTYVPRPTEEQKLCTSVS